MNDRRGIKQEFANVDEAVRREIVETLAEIIREAYKTQKIKENTK